MTSPYLKRRARTRKEQYPYQTHNDLFEYTIVDPYGHIRLHAPTPYYTIPHAPTPAGPHAIVIPDLIGPIYRLGTTLAPYPSAVVCKWLILKAFDVNDLDIVGYHKRCRGLVALWRSLSTMTQMSRTRKKISCYPKDQP